MDCRDCYNCHLTDESNVNKYLAYDKPGKIIKGPREYLVCTKNIWSYSETGEPKPVHLNQSEVYSTKSNVHPEIQKKFPCPECKIRTREIFQYFEGCREREI